MDIKHNWTIVELQEIYHTPLLMLVSRANKIHCHYHDRNEVQLCGIISIKTGGCQEDCRYCAQSSFYKTPVKAQAMMEVEEVIQAARSAIERGASRVCLSAAWREIRDGKQFEQILEMVKEITAMGIEVCTTLGMLQDHQAQKLAEAGVYAYNHNLDSSRNFYPNVTTTRTYDDRLQTLDRVEKAGMTVCCGGILGMGETADDRISLIHTLANRENHPASVPINRLTPIPGTPFGELPKFPIWEMLRTIATARIAMPKAMVRLSAGRLELSNVEQTLCFLAGANSIFSGEKLLTVANTPVDRDQEMFDILGLKKQQPFAKNAH